MTTGTDTHHIDNLRSLPAERAVIASLLGYQGIGNDLNLILRPEMFYEVMHGQIFTICLQLDRLGGTVNHETVANAMQLERDIKGITMLTVNPFEFIQNISKECLPSPNFIELAEIVRDRFRAREYYSLCQQALGQFGEKSFAESKEWFDKSLVALHSSGSSHHTRKMSEVMLEEFHNLAAISENKGEDETLILPTGFKGLDQMLGGGMPNERLCCILGATGMGKTTLLLEILFSSAYIHRQPTLFFSLEMGSNSQAQKYFSKHAKISTQHLQAGRISESQWARIYQTTVDYEPVPLEIDDQALTIEEIVSTSRAFYAKHGSIGVIAVDFLTLVETSKGGRTLDVVNHVLKQLNQLKKELKTRVYVLCQIGRAVKERQDKRPKIEDAKESGMVEELSDLLLSCFRDEYYNPESVDRGTLELAVLKSRYTNLDTFKLIFDGANSSIYDMQGGSNAF